MHDTIARQLDVPKDSIKYDLEPGTGRYRVAVITFAPKKGQSVDLQKIHESLKGTRLGKGTRSAVNFFEITAEGDVTVADKDTRLQVSGTGQQFILVDDPKAQPKEGKKTPYQRLKEALAQGEKIANVTGRVQGWNGTWPTVLKALSADAKKPTVLVVTDFLTVQK